jgi:hypothetical protein
MSRYIRVMLLLIAIVVAMCGALGVFLTGSYGPIPSGEIHLLSDGHFEDWIRLQFDIEGRDLVYCALDEGYREWETTIRFYDDEPGDEPHGYYVSRVDGVFEVDIPKREQYDKLAILLNNKERLTAWSWGSREGVTRPREAGGSSAAADAGEAQAGETEADDESE